MSIEQVEVMSTILIGYGAKRIAKDLVNTMIHRMNLDFMCFNICSKPVLIHIKYSNSIFIVGLVPLIAFLRFT